jgi:DNA-damage-inducible protein D
MTNELGPPATPEHTSPFERIRRTNAAGNEFWSSRDFAGVLGYTDYRNFEQVIGKARLACFNSGQRVEDHFVDITDMVAIGSNAQRAIKTVMLSRYACYLAIQNADPTKEIVAHGQTYFAVQTRRQELADQPQEDERRLLLRDEMRTHNLRLAEAAKTAGVINVMDYAIFQNHGYQGLYGGLTAQDIHRRKGLKKSQQILDHMGSTELAANLFRATQTEEKLRRENIKGGSGPTGPTSRSAPRCARPSGNSVGPCRSNCLRPRALRNLRRASAISPTRSAD